MPRYTTRPDLFPGEPFPLWPCVVKGPGQNGSLLSCNTAVACDTDTGAIGKYSANGLDGCRPWATGGRADVLFRTDPAGPLTVEAWPDAPAGWAVTSIEANGLTAYRYERADGATVRPRGWWVPYGPGGELIDGPGYGRDTVAEACAAVEAAFPLAEAA